jgi:hypothetical protein
VKTNELEKSAARGAKIGIREKILLILKNVPGIIT